jgi:hypothetical protein
LGDAAGDAAMSCGLIRLICEEPSAPPAGQDGKPLVVDVEPHQVVAEVARLQAEGWRVVS